MNQTKTASGGFTLIELLVVMAIILLLGGLIGPRVIEAYREANLTASKKHLESVYSALQRYESKKKRLPGKEEDGTVLSGPAFICSIWGDPWVEKSKSNAEIFFCSSLAQPPLTEENVDDWVTPENIHWAGLNQEDKNFAKGRITAKNSSKTIIACNKPEVEGEQPHAGRTLAVLYLDGHVGQMDREAWGEDWGKDEPLTIGPESPVEALHGLVGDEGY